MEVHRIEFSGAVAGHPQPQDHQGSEPFNDHPFRERNFQQQRAIGDQAFRGRTQPVPCPYLHMPNSIGTMRSQRVDMSFDERRFMRPPKAGVPSGDVQDVHAELFGHANHDLCGYTFFSSAHQQQFEWIQAHAQYSAQEGTTSTNGHHYSPPTVQQGRPCIGGQVHQVEHGSSLHYAQSVFGKHR